MAEPSDLPTAEIVPMDGGRALLFKISRPVTAEAIVIENESSFLIHASVVLEHNTKDPARNRVRIVLKDPRAVKEVPRG